MQLGQYFVQGKLAALQYPAALLNVLQEVLVVVVAVLLVVGQG